MIQYTFEGEETHRNDHRPKCQMEKSWVVSILLWKVSKGFHISGKLLPRSYNFLENKPQISNSLYRLCIPRGPQRHGKMERHSQSFHFITS